MAALQPGEDRESPPAGIAEAKNAFSERRERERG